MKRNQKGFSAIELLLALVIVGLIGAVGWYVWQSKKAADQSLKNASSQDGVAQAPKKPAEQPVDGTADWKTITAPDNTTLKIPSDWSEKTCDVGDGTTTLGVASSKDGLGACRSDAVSEIVFLVSNRVDIFDNASTNETKLEDDQAVTVDKLTINGVEARRIARIKKTDPKYVYAGFLYITYYLKHNGKLYSASYTHNGTAPNHQDILFKIVQTWKF